ncbi:tyrosine-type recombinase/integrase [Paenibacillus sp. S3N08]|uniref:Tyrosine-type recombinase/integrase n=2 Tax=Paenibacillus agricola TaxID=2716264 RepID=A0ABX0IX97_9BACL|nr:tyrosine-type recombinase/integrase [Paenibacillus agricola]
MMVRLLNPGGKSKNSIRSIAIDYATLNELKKHQRLINQEKMHLGEQYEDNGLVVCTSKGTLMSPRNLNRTWYRLLGKSELPKIRFHDLRHSHASLLMKLDQHPKIVQERLGHSSIRITLDTYSHVMPNMQQDAAQKIGSMLL